MKKRFLECGQIVSTHGIRGEVKVRHWCDSPEYLCGFAALYLSGGEQVLKVEQARTHKDMALIKFAGINDMDSAAALRGKTLYLDREDAPDDGTPFIQDLMGMEVKDADSGKVYGILTDVFETGANNVYEITGPDGVKRLVPAIPQVIESADTDSGIMEIRPLEGLLDGIGDGEGAAHED